MAGYVYARDFQPNWQANTSQRMQISQTICQSSRWPCPLLHGREGHFNRQSFTIRLRSIGSLHSFSRISLSLSLSLSPSIYLSVSISVSPPLFSSLGGSLWFLQLRPDFDVFLHLSNQLPSFSPQPVARVSRLKRHLLIVAPLRPLAPASTTCVSLHSYPLVFVFFVSSPCLSLFPLSRVILSSVCTRCSDSKLIFESTDQRLPVTNVYLFLRTPCAAK